MSANQAPWLERIAPDLTGPAGKAWRWSMDGAPEGDARNQSTLAQWLLLAPGAHPLWSWHLLTGIDLAPYPGLPPAKLQYPGAEYELLVLALDPDGEIPPPDRYPQDGSVKFLMPPDVVTQFHNVPGGRDQAVRLLELFALAVVDGHLVPDSDHRGSWERSLAATLQHARQGLHDL